MSLLLEAREMGNLNYGFTISYTELFPSFSKDDRGSLTYIECLRSSLTGMIEVTLLLSLDPEIASLRLYLANLC